MEAVEGGAAAAAALASRSWLELAQDSVDLDFAGHKVWYDQSNKQLVLMRKNVFCTVDLQGGKRSAPINFIQLGKTLDVKLSLCRRYLAIQRTDTTVEIVDMARGTQVTLSCKSKRANLVLRGGVLWLRREACKIDLDGEPQVCLCLVTRFGLEIFRLPAVEKGERACKALGVVKHNVQCFWHLADHHVLLLSSGNGTEMRPYQFQGGHLPTKLAKFLLPSAPAHRNIVVAKLYDSIYCVHLDIEARALQVFKLGREATLLSKTLRLFATESVGVSVVDNLVCIHNMEGKFTCIYDIAADTDNPCTIPKAMHLAWQDPSAAPPAPPGQVADIDVILEGGPEQARRALQACAAKHRPSDAQGAGELFHAELCAPMQNAPQGSYVSHVNGVSVANRSYEEVVAAVEEGGASAVVLRVVVAAPAQGEGEAATEATTEGKNGNSQLPLSSADVLYAKSWVFLEPFWILDAKRGRIWRIELNLDSVPALAQLEANKGSGRAGPDELVEPSFLLRDTRRLFSFLLRRTCGPPRSSRMEFLYGGARRDERAYAKGVLLCYLRELMAATPDAECETAAVAFKLINDTYLKALRERAASPAAAAHNLPSGAPNSANAFGVAQSAEATPPTTPSSEAGAGGQPSFSSSAGASLREGTRTAINRIRHRSSRDETAAAMVAAAALGGGGATLARPSMAPWRTSSDSTDARTASERPNDSGPLLARTGASASSLPLSLAPSIRSQGAERDHGDDRSQDARGDGGDASSCNSSQGLGDGASMGSLGGSEFETASRRCLDQLLADFAKAGKIALKDIRCYGGMTVVLQIDIFTWVFVPLMQRSSEAQVRGGLSMYLCEYIRSLQQHMIPIEKYMHELLAWALITAGQEYVLHQLLQYHVPTDSKRLARTLLEASAHFRPFLQVALDMFYRLGCIDCVVRALLSCGRLQQALSVLRQHSHFLDSRAKGRNLQLGQSGRGSGLQSANSNNEGELVAPCELLECAIAQSNSRGGDVAPFIALHSFFLSVDPFAIETGVGGSPSPLGLAFDLPLPSAPLGVSAALGLRQA